MRPFFPLLALALGGCGSRPAVPVPDSGEPRVVHTRDGMFGLYFPPKVKPAPAVVVLPGDHGLSKQIEDHARKLRDLGYAVVLVDLYRGEKVDNVLDAHILDRGLPQDRVKADVRTAIDGLLSDKDVRPGAVAVVGWDMGGGYALEMATEDARIRAVVTCYGKLITDAAALKKMNASVLALMAGLDDGNGVETREAFRRAMAKAGKKLSLEVFEGCDHGFLNPPPGAKTGPKDAAATEEAWKRIAAFLAAELGEK